MNDGSTCYVCHKRLGTGRGFQMHFYGRVADYLGFPRSGLTFCHACYHDVLKRWEEAVRVTSGQVYSAALAACTGDNSPDPEPGDS